MAAPVPVKFLAGNGIVSLAAEHGDVRVLEGVSANLQPAAGSGSGASGTLALALRGLVPASRHKVPLGCWSSALSTMRWMACARCKLWWMTPAWGGASDPLPTETQFLLLRADANVAGVEPPYVLLLPLVTGSFRSSIEASRSPGGLELVAESVDSKTQAAEVDPVLVIAAAAGPYEAIRHGFSFASQLLGGSFRLREEKQRPASMEMFGWCTWDAFMDKVRYTSLVTPEGIAAGIRGFAEAKVPVRHLIIDDGWQTVGTDIDTEREMKKSPPMPATTADLKGILQEQEGIINKDVKDPSPSPSSSGGETPKTPSAIARFYSKWVEHAPTGSVRLELWALLCGWFSTGLKRSIAANDIDQAKRLRSVTGNATFETAKGERSLKELVSLLKDELGVRSVYCWHHLLGYWCGLEPLMDEFKDLKVQRQPMVLAQGIETVEPGMRWSHFKSMAVGLPSGQEGAATLYGRMHHYLKEAGVDGVKVDGQAVIGQVGEGLGGGPAMSRHWITALEDSVERHFGSAQCITCMCHANENLFNYARSSVCRASDDFFPDNPASQAAHIAHAAFNSVFLSEISTPDWDMFHSKHPSGKLHAAARAVSGGAIYVSDPPGEHDFDLLRQLVTADGRVLLCDGPARPTRDTLFCDPQLDGQTALKIFNSNGGGRLGVVAAFNVQGALWDRQHRRFDLRPEGQVEVQLEVRPRDVEAFRSNECQTPKVSKGFAMHRYSKAGEVELLAGNDAGTSLQLAREDFEVVTYSPILELRTSAGDALVAPIGLWRMLNPGGAVRRMSESEEGLEIFGQGNGPFLTFATLIPKSCHLAQDPSVSVDDGQFTGLAPVSLAAEVRATNKGGGPAVQTFEVIIPDTWAAVGWVLSLSW